MDHPSEVAFALRSRDASAMPPVLTGVDVLGRLDGVLSSLTLRQTYRNAGTHNLEVVYTFPLPAGAVLLGFAAQLDGRRLEAEVLARSQAEQQCEQALADGDAPVLLEVSQAGIHTASIGNLRPGQSIVLETRFAQLLPFEQGRLRLAIPTTIAPRYGDATRGGLHPHQRPDATLAVDYPLTLALEVRGWLAGAALACPSHAHRVTPVEGGVRAELEPGARLDRDVVFVLTPAEPRPDLLIVADDRSAPVAPKVALAAFELPRPDDRPRIRLRLLVDCSGSMAGDSIASAREALRGVVDGLTLQDEVSFSRFGDAVDHVRRPAPLGADEARLLRLAIDETQASMGGTRMQEALQAVFAAWPQPEGEPADVLLITDGEVWESAALAAAGRRSGHRVFAIGVGSAPAENVLRDLAHATGGACEFATPGEALGAAARRMLARIRQTRPAGLRVDWGAPAAWQLDIAGPCFGGDTVFALAGFAAPHAPQGPVWLRARGADGGEVEVARTRAGAPCTGQDLARVAAARRVPEADDRTALQLALDYQLLTQATHCVLVHRRADQDKPAQPARLQRLPTMMAAGWGGTGRIGAAQALRTGTDNLPTTDALYMPSVWRSRLPTLAAAVDSMVSPGKAEFEIPAFLRKRSGDDAVDSMTSAGKAEFEIPAFLREQAGDDAPEMSLRQIAARVAAHLARGAAIASLPSHCQRISLAPPLRQAVDELDALGVSRHETWLLLALWVALRRDRQGAPELVARLEWAARDITPLERQRVFAVLDQYLGACGSDSWVTSRLKRLIGAMGGLG